MDELPPGGFELSTSRQGPTSLVRLVGELDLANRERVREALRAAERGDAESVLLDLTELTFLDSTGLAVIVEANERLRRC